MSSKKKKHLRGKGKPESEGAPAPEEIIEATADAEAEVAAAHLADEEPERSPADSAPETAKPESREADDSASENRTAQAAEPVGEATEEPEDPSDGGPRGSETDQQLLPMVPLRAVLEAILLVSPEPVEPGKLVRSFPEFSREEVEKTLADLVEEYSPEGRGLRIKLVAEGYRLETRPEFDPWLDRFFEVENEAKLSLAALETLAIIAYRQPITQPEINEIRGVNSGGVVRTLAERKLIKIHGRKAVVGSPFLYRTTRAFLEHFGLASLSELPKPEEMEQLLGEGVKLPGELGQLALPTDLGPEDGDDESTSEESELAPVEALPTSPDQAPATTTEPPVADDPESDVADSTPKNEAHEEL